MHLLEEARAQIDAAATRTDVGPAGEWLLDNFYVVRDHVAEIRESLPRGFYRELPELSSGPLTGHPRVYELAIALISHSEGRIDLENLGRFTTAFQAVSPLSIGELWALPAMLRLGLVENVRRMTLRTVQRLDAMETADIWAARIQQADEEGPLQLSEAFGRLDSEHPPLGAEFVARLQQQTRVSGVSRTASAWLEQWLLEAGFGPDDATGATRQRLALTQVTMANSIVSLRTVAGTDWPAFVESQSVLEATLRSDDSDVYSRMTFDSRDQYRHAIERLARRARLEEVAVARRAVDLAAAARGSKPADPRQAHVGFYLLVDSGRSLLEAAIGYQPSLGERLTRWMRRSPSVVLGGGMFVGTCLALAGLLWLVGAEVRTAWPVVLVLGLLPAHEIGLNLFQQLATTVLLPTRLPKLDFVKQGGVPPEYRTAVVVPTLFEDVPSVEHALENLEVQYLANREAHLHFVLLSDFTDSPTEHTKDDAAIIDAAVRGVEALNLRYGENDDAPFHLLHRSRRWNAAQGVWMGWERKRGKLAELNQLLLGGPPDGFPVVVGPLAALQRVRYVITLDADTVLPPDEAPELIGAMAHPLNHPVWDEARGRIVRGYGILQPRVGVSLPSANRTLFATIASGTPGVDPYTTAVSDLYQDLYAEGSFTGKGIYDVDAFERATRGRFPENALLSHDLIEGAFARAGLATDIEVFDDFPSSYLTWTRRKHRWIRGDWQLLRWLTPTVPGPRGPEANPLPLLARWKLLDNLRRSLLELALLAFWIVGWAEFPHAVGRWTVLGVLAVAAPWVVTLLLAALHPPIDKSWRSYYGALGQDALASARQFALALVFLPHQAWISLDAIARTLWRVGVSRRHLLDWQTSSHAEGSRRGRAWRQMWASPVVACGSAALLIWVLSREQPGPLAPGIIPLALVVLWLAAPALADA
ncbi:MAG TPA: carbohydrate-binding protein, partial [Myxococcaceae bacterium]